MESPAEFLNAQEIMDLFKQAGVGEDGAKPKGNAANEAAFTIPKEVGQRVWIRHADYKENDQDNISCPFYQAKVLKDEGDECLLKLWDGEVSKEGLFKGEFKLKSNLIMEWSEMANKGLADMIEIDELNHATILWNLHQRYFKDDIYTYVGPTLLAVNPFQFLTQKYPDTIIEDYKEITTADGNYIDVLRRLQPHTFAVSAFAHRQMRENQIRQGIVISGESGAGKTESAKQAMAFLTCLGTKGVDTSKAKLEDRILSTNPVLEAFGNSRTARNDNSSRFGKYIKLYFDKDDGLCSGAEIKNYLLEKSRVTGCTPVERNYHIFFFILRGADSNTLQRLGMTDDKGERKKYTDFRYLKECNDKKVFKDKDGNEKTGTMEAKDIENYQELSEAFKQLGFKQEEVDAIHDVTAAALYCGEIQLDGSTYSDTGKTPTPVSIKNEESVKHIAKLLGIQDYKELITELVNKDKMDGIDVRIPDKLTNVANAVGSLAKGLFDNMFNWLVDYMNQEILPEDLKSQNQSDIQRFKEKSETVGLLDIFGFENFELNQFEQLCINYVNEKLHYLYISSIFGAEKKEMEREGIDVKLKMPDLKVIDVIKLMDCSKQPQGIFQTVHDKSGVQMGKDDPVKKAKELHQKILENHSSNTKVFTERKRTSKFTIRHSAKDVEYDSKNFIERNQDSMSGALSMLLLKKTSPVVQRIYSQKAIPQQEEETKDQKKGGRKAPPRKGIWAKFSVQINELMEELAEPLIPKDLTGDKPEPEKKGKEDPPPTCPPCDLHFIRCLKPNEKKKPRIFSHAMTLQQINYMGVLESISVKQENFPYRKKYQEFYRIYELLSPCYGDGRYDMMSEATKDSKDWKALTLQIMDRVFSPIPKSKYENSFVTGNTKIMMNTEIYLVLEKSKHKASAVYDNNAACLKRSYVLSEAQKKLRSKLIKIKIIQRSMKKAYQRLQKSRADALQLKIQNSIVLFKTEKRKEFETETSDVIEEVFQKHVFREYLQKSIQSRHFMMKGLIDLATINRCRKLWICRRAVAQIVDRAFMRGKAKKEQDAVYRIQRIVRGHMERAGKENLVLNAVKCKVELKQHVSAKRIQKRLKGLIVRRRLKHLDDCTSRIQASMKMKWTRRVFTVIKQNVIILQKAYRRYMARRDQIKIRLLNYLTQELQVIENVKAMEYAQLHGNLVNRNQAQKMGLLKSLTPYSIKKISFFTRVIDLSILIDLSEIYTHPWSTQWLKAMAESTHNDAPIMNISAGKTHTMIVNSKCKVYTWGWNDNGQCTKPFDLNEIILSQPTIKNSQVDLESALGYQSKGSNSSSQRVKQSIAVQDRCLLLTQETGEIICWGGNEKGQLGLGHYQDVNTPTKIDTFSKSGIKVSYIASGGDLSICCSEKGDAYAWPFIQNGIKQSFPTRMPFSEKTLITKVTCGQNFGFFISNQGLVYSFGEDNSDGQLGLGHTYPTEYPELIQCFRDIGEKIETIECGFRHTIAKSSLGKIYTWGSSNKGQLGHDHFDSELSPRTLNIDKKNNKKIHQIAAGYSHTMVMMETNKEIYWFGTCGNLQDQAFPIQLDFSKYMPDLFGPQGPVFGNMGGGDDTKPSLMNLGSQTQDFHIVKINTSWSKTMTISSMLIADLRAVNQETNYTRLLSSLNTLGSRWDPRDIMPPYIDSISGLFASNIMRKPAGTANDKVNKKPSNKSKAPGKGSSMAESLYTGGGVLNRR